MKIMSYNVNGIRARIPHLLGVLEKFRPAILGIQETKVTDEEFPLDVLTETGYHVVCHGEKGHYGVAILSQTEPSRVQKGFPFDGEDAQRRMITATWDLPSGRKLEIINSYFPQGESRTHPVKFPAKQKFYADLLTFLQQDYRSEDALVVLGDMNIAPVDEDIGIGEANAKRWLKTGKTSFLPEEREWLGYMLDWGLQDSFRVMNQEENNRFSWFDYRSRGFEREPKRGLRIDLILASKVLMDHCRETGIDYTFRAMSRPSDHCPIWADFDLE